MDEKTSLEKSHSRVSNFRLTFFCFLALLFVSGLWLGIGLIGNETLMYYGIVITCCSIILTLVFMLIINNFTR